MLRLITRVKKRSLYAFSNINPVSVYNAVAETPRKHRIVIKDGEMMFQIPLHLLSVVVSGRKKWWATVCAEIQQSIHSVMKKEKIRK